ncbi:unnamed protein product [Caenorhabditis brenneri]
MSSGGALTKKAESLKTADKMTEEATTSDQQRITGTGATSQESDQNPIQSRKRPRLSSTEQKNLVVDPATPPSPGRYGVGGLYKATEGEVLDKRYKIKELLGSGAFASVHKAEDQTTKNTVAVKIIRSKKRSNDTSNKEVGLMKRVKEEASASKLDSGSGRGTSPDSPIGSNNVIRLLHNFQIEGTNGIHEVLVIEMLGPNLFNVLNKSNHKILNLQRIQRFSKDILSGLDFLHSKCEIMHLDLKPENLLVMVDPKNMDLADRKCSASLKIGDFGLSEDSKRNVKRTVQTCNYRAPEAHLKAKITPSADIWSFGCVLYEMVTRELLFPCNGRDNCDKKWHLERISELLGPIESKYFERDEEDKKKFVNIFGDIDVYNGYLNEENVIAPNGLSKKNENVCSQAQALSEFLEKILKIDPKKRPSAGDALNHPFLNEESSP